MVAPRDKALEKKSLRDFFDFLFFLDFLIDFVNFFFVDFFQQSVSDFFSALPLGLYLVKVPILLLHELRKFASS